MNDHPVKLAQCLCPKRHCIVALSFMEDVSDESTIESMKAAVFALTYSGSMKAHPELAIVREAMHLPEGIDPWCGLCGAKKETWMYEVGRVRKGTTLDDLRDMERHQRESAELLRLLGLAPDERRKN